MAGENKEAPVLTNEAIEAKVAKGEALTESEREFIKGNPNLEASEEEGGEEGVGEGEAGEEGEEEKSGEGEESETGEEKETPAPAKSKPGESKKETPAPKQTPAERQALIESELAKPAGQQDLSKFTESEVGVFIDLKKQRAKNQRLQEENDALKFEKLKGKLKPEETAEEEEDLLAGLGDEDIVTAKQLKEILAKNAKKPAKKEAAPVITPETVAANEVTAEANLKAKGLDDYKDVSQYVQFALYDDPDAPALLIDAAKKGENVAETAYWMVKGSKKWPMIKGLIAQEKAKVSGGGKAGEEKKAPPAESVERGERFKKNTEKVKTTGSGGGAGDEVGEITAQDVAKMSVAEFRALPRETRDKILKKYGSEPNMSK